MKGCTDRASNVRVEGQAGRIDFQPTVDYPPGITTVGTVAGSITTAGAAQPKGESEYNEASMSGVEVDFSALRRMPSLSSSFALSSATRRSTLARRQGIISMRQMIIERYGRELTQHLAESINQGETEVCEQGHFAADADEMEVTDVFFTRTSLCSIYVDVYLTATLLSQDVPWATWTTQEFRCGMNMYLFEDEAEDVDFDRCYPANHRRSHVDGIPLDDYWVPYYNAENVEEAVEDILRDNCPHMLEDPKAIDAKELATALGLRVINLPLYKKRQTASILYFTDGEVILRDEDGKPYSQHIGGKTIVLNDYYIDRPQASQTAIFHECFHYVEHYLFFRGQSMCNNDVAKFAPWKEEAVLANETTGTDGSSPERKRMGGRRKRNQANPIRCLEWQANRASYCMMMPKSLISPRLRKGLEKLTGMDYHMGKKFDIICRNLAEEFSAPKYCARYRAINMGYIAAKGALNYIGDRYIEPFAFSHDSCRGDYSFAISAKDVLHEYVSNAEFRDQIDKGHYVYVDGHMCVDDERFVVKDPYGCRMTRYANANVDKCCLRFRVNYVVDEDEGYVYGQLRSDAEYNERYLTYDRMTENMTILQRTTLYTEIIASLSKPAYKAIVEHMGRLEITTEQMAERCGIHESTIKRIRRGDKKMFTLDQIVIICIGLHLPPELSEDLMARSNNLFLREPEDDTKEARERFMLHMIYRVLLRSFYLLPLRDIQKKLASEHQLMLEFSKPSISVAM